MTPTGRCLWLLAGWSLLGLAASLKGGLVTAWWVVGAVLLVAWLVDLAVLRWASAVQLERVLPGRFALGEEGRVLLDFRNESPRRLAVEIFDGIPEGAVAEAMPWQGRVEKGGRARISHRVRLMERGFADFRPMHLRVLSPLGCWKWRRILGRMEQARVYPDYEPVVRFALLAMQARQDQMGIVRRSLAGSSRDFHQLREYREGDPLAQIDWKASSRKQELISREFQEQRNQTIVFLTDTGRRMRALDGKLPQFDHCLNAMLLLSYVALRQGDQVGVQAFGGTRRWLPPVKGAHSMSVLLNHLFDYRTSPEPSDFTQAAEELMVRQRRRALVVLLTNLRGEDGPELIPALRILAGRHLVMLASLREASIEAARRHPVGEFRDALRFASAERYDAERAEVLAGLRGFGVLTLDVPAGDLPVELANRYLDIKAAGRL